MTLYVMYTYIVSRRILAEAIRNVPTGWWNEWMNEQPNGEYIWKMMSQNVMLIIQFFFASPFCLLVCFPFCFPLPFLVLFILSKSSRRWDKIKRWKYTWQKDEANERNRKKKPNPIMLRKWLQGHHLIQNYSYRIRFSLSVWVSEF